MKRNNNGRPDRPKHVAIAHRGAVRIIPVLTVDELVRRLDAERRKAEDLDEHEGDR